MNQPFTLTTTKYCIITILSISGLKWCDTKAPHLSGYSLLPSATVSPYLSTASAILLLIGTNSLCQFNASQVI